MERKEIDNNREEEKKKRRGRKRKEDKQEEEIKKDKNKFYIDVSQNKEEKEIIQNTLNSINNKSYGKEITLKEILMFLISKITPKDIEKLQDSSLTEMEKVKRALDDHNRKNGSDLNLGEFLTKKLGIN